MCKQATACTECMFKQATPSTYTACKQGLPFAKSFLAIPTVFSSTAFSIRVATLMKPFVTAALIWSPV